MKRRLTQVLSTAPLTAKLNPMLDRRQFGSGLAAGALVLAMPGMFALPAFAQRDVAVDKLMAPGALPDITIGNKDAKVTIVEYASMSCPHCAAFHKTVLPKLKEKYITPGKVLMVMREFPLNEIAVAVSMLTRCASDNDKSAALVDVYFEQQDKWLVNGDAEPKLREIAKQAGFTKEAFDTCLANEEIYNKLVQQREVASKEFGVNRTPSFFINGQALKGDIMDVQTFAAVIDPLLKAQG